MEAPGTEHWDSEAFKNETADFLNLLITQNKIVELIMILYSCSALLAYNRSLKRDSFKESIIDSPGSFSTIHELNEAE